MYVRTNGWASFKLVIRLIFVVQLVPSAIIADQFNFAVNFHPEYELMRPPINEPRMSRDHN